MNGARTGTLKSGWCLVHGTHDSWACDTYAKPQYQCTCKCHERNQ